MIKFKLIPLIIIISVVLISSCEAQHKNELKKPLVKIDKEKFKAEDPLAYKVLFEAATERPYTSDLLDNTETGVYVCKACKAPLFVSDNKFDAGCGWPSFDREIEGAITYDVDYKIGVPRIEEKCSNCGGHLGHVFDDGPKDTTGKRHCINGIALEFIPSEKQ